jgi:phage shock protein E
MTKILTTSKTGVITMRVRDHSMPHGSLRIDVKISLGTVKARPGNFKELWQTHILLAILMNSPGTLFFVFKPVTLRSGTVIFSDRGSSHPLPPTRDVGTRLYKVIKTEYHLPAMTTIQAPIISPTEAQAKVRNGAFLVDVRTPQEFQEGHLPGATLINSEELFSRIQEFGSDKKREVVLYCKSGGRSQGVADHLMSIGFERVFNAGGYKELLPLFE